MFSSRVLKSLRLKTESLTSKSKTKQTWSWDQCYCSLCESLPENLPQGEVWILMMHQPINVIIPSYCSLLRDTRDLAENALKAANAYQDIVDAIDAAEAAAKAALNASKEAEKGVSGSSFDSTCDYMQSCFTFTCYFSQWLLWFIVIWTNCQRHAETTKNTKQSCQTGLQSKLQSMWAN